MYRAAFIQGYQICALWTSTKDDGSTMDEYGIDAIAPESDKRMEADCDRFIAANRRDLSRIEPGQAGYDLWLTRNGHGTGYWDRDLGGRGDRLTAAAKALGGCSLYLGDDGKIHQSNEAARHLCQG